MIDGLIKNQKSQEKNYKFSVLIPTWNNLQYLKLCISSLRKNSGYKIQIIVFINEGNDGTEDWLKSQSDIDFIKSESNLGICYGLNLCRSLVKSDYIVYMNDDMYALPEWDVAIKNEINNLNTKMFVISSTMIEPRDTGNKAVLVGDYGDEISNFKEEKLLTEYKKFKSRDWNGSTWPPTIVHTEVWDMVGGLSVEFSPGIYSDPDFSRKLYEAGVRIFKGVGDSLVYHFGCKSTNRLKTNKGRKIFLMKWNISPKTFTEDYLKMGEKFKVLESDYSINQKSKFLNKLKVILTTFK